MLKLAVVLGAELCPASELLAQGCLLPRPFTGAQETVGCSRLQITSMIIINSVLQTQVVSLGQITNLAVENA